MKSSPISVVRKDVEEIVQEVGAPLYRLEGKTLLISGGTGFIGSYFLNTVAYLNSELPQPCRVITVDASSGHSARRFVHLRDDPNFTFLKEDVSQMKPPAGPVHFIIHAAAIASPSVYRQKPLETIDGIVWGLRNLLEIARRNRVEGFMYFSTSEVYGDPLPDFIPTPEEYRGNVSCTGPRACYDESKRFGETLCTVYRRLYDLPVRIVRPFNVYGPGLPLTDRRVIPDLINDAVRGAPLTLYSDGCVTRSFCYISDAMVGFWRALLSPVPAEPVNIGNDREEIAIHGLAQMLSEILGDGREIVYRKSADPDYLTDNPQRRCPDLTRARTLLSYEPRIVLREGLRRTLAWAQEEGLETE